MTFPLRTTSTPPPPLRKIPPHTTARETDEYMGIEDLDRPELDEVPDTDRTPPTLPSLEWDDKDGESGVKQRRSV